MANQLIHEQSPYLLQHAHNPVDWHPWGEDAFALARAQHKPVIISIGYAACHWCHVMERESFEDEATAAFMNEHFINIKVDREEYPDVDDFYMSAVQTLTGSGGWPLNVFATPGKLPFYGGTYFPPAPVYGRPSWMQLLIRMQEVWMQHQETVDQQAAQMMSHLANAALQATPKDIALWSAGDLKHSRDAMLQYADKERGGFGRAPKFPAPMAISYLLEYARYNEDEAARAHALRSLDAMMEGGIYDQIGGGFARYATDDAWLVPHFEKMLYDNAQLIAVYCDAYAGSGDLRYKAVATETIAFVMREMRAENAGYYSALDADSEGVEGKFYTWDYAAWREAAQHLDPLVGAYFGVSETGNWEHTNILHVAHSVAELAASSGRDEALIRKHIEAAKTHLFRLRQARIRPGTDDKCLLSWNSLMNIALTKAYLVLGDEQYLSEAVRHMHWMLDTYIADGKLMHTWKAGLARIGANLDDYAYLIQALLQLLAATGEKSWQEMAEKLVLETLQYFSAGDVLLMYFTSSQENNIPLRKPETYDGVTPSSNAVMAHNLYLLGMLAERSEWIDMAEGMLLQMKETARRYPTSFAYWNIIAQRMVAGMKTVKVSSGADQGILLVRLRKALAPHCFCFAETENSVTMPERDEEHRRSMIFICNKSSCLAPIEGNLENIDFAIF